MAEGGEFPPRIDPPEACGPVIGCRQGDWFGIGVAVGRRHTDLGYGQAVLTQDPLRENVHRCLMACHNSMGNRPLAIRQYQECARILQQELGIPPMEVTRELCRQIETGSARWTDALGRPDLMLMQGVNWR